MNRIILKQKKKKTNTKLCIQWANLKLAELDNILVPHDIYSGGGKQVSIKHMSGGASRKEESKVAEDESWWL